MLIVDTNFNFFNKESLQHACKIFEEDNNDKENFKKNLITSIPLDGSKTLSLILSASFSNIFDDELEFFDKYLDSWIDLQDAILASNAYDIICPIQHSSYNKYKELIQKVFENDTSRLAERIEIFFYELEYKIDFDFGKIENLRDFLNYVFKNNQLKIYQVIQEIFKHSCEIKSEILDHHRVKYPSRLQNYRRVMEALLSMFNRSLRNGTNRNSYLKYQRILNMD